MYLLEMLFGKVFLSRGNYGFAQEMPCIHYSHILVNLTARLFVVWEGAVATDLSSDTYDLPTGR